jgi:hypothetical protein
MVLGACKLHLLAKTEGCLVQTSLTSVLQPYCNRASTGQYAADNPKLRLS